MRKRVIGSLGVIYRSSLNSAGASTASWRRAAIAEILVAAVLEQDRAHCPAGAGRRRSCA